MQASAAASEADVPTDAAPTDAAPTDAAPIRVFFDGQRFLVWNTRDMYTLRCLHRIVAGLVGALPTNKRQTQEYGMPLSLLFEEALLLAEEGIAEVVDASGLSHAAVPPLAAAADAASTEAAGAFPTNGWCGIDAECGAWARDALPKLEPHQIRLAPGARLLHAPVYRALWARGFFITCGSGFGADYLCYPGDPMRHHAHLLIHVARPGRPSRAIEQGCAARLANSVKKTGVLAEVIEGNDVRFSPIEQPTIELGPPPVRGEAQPDADADGGGAAAGDDDAAHEAIAEAKALRAPVEGGPQVPAPRVKTRRARAPWEAEESNPGERRKR